MSDSHPIEFGKLESALFCMDSLLSVLSAPFFNDSFESYSKLEKELAKFIRREHLEKISTRLEFGENFPFFVLLIPILEISELLLKEAKQEMEEIEDKRIVEQVMQFCARLRNLIFQLGKDKLHTKSKGPEETKFEIKLDIKLEDLLTAFDSVEEIQNYYQQSLSEEIPSVKIESIKTGSLNITGTALKSDFIPFIKKVMTETDDHSIMGSPVMRIWVENCFTIEDTKKAALIWKGFDFEQMNKTITAPEKPKPTQFISDDLLETFKANKKITQVMSKPYVARWGLKKWNELEDRMYLIIYVFGEKRTQKVGEYLQDVQYVVVLQAKKTAPEYNQTNTVGGSTDTPEPGHELSHTLLNSNVGTIGGFLYKKVPTTQFVLTNYHVIETLSSPEHPDPAATFDARDTMQGNKYVSPPRALTESDEECANRAFLEYTEHCLFTRDGLDFALLSVNDKKKNGKPLKFKNKNVCPPESPAASWTKNWTESWQGLHVYKIGSKTGITCGIIDMVVSTLNESWDEDTTDLDLDTSSSSSSSSSSGEGSSDTTTPFNKNTLFLQIKKCTQHTYSGPFSLHGDSGSIILVEKDEKYFIAALHCRGETETTAEEKLSYGIPIHCILSRLPDFRFHCNK